MIDVFISYAHLDLNRYVRPLVAELKRCRISIWLDQIERRENDSLPNYLEQGIRLSKFTLVFMSDTYVGREWTEYELKTVLKFEAQINRNVMIPIIFDNEQSLSKEYDCIAGRERFFWRDGPAVIANSLHAKLLRLTMETIKTLDDSDLFYYLENINDYGVDIHGLLFGDSVPYLVQAEIISRGLANQHSLALYQDGIALIASRDLSAAHAKFLEAATASPRFIAAHNNVGATNLDLGNLYDAQRVYERDLASVRTFYICKNRCSLAIESAAVPKTADLMFILRDLIISYRYTTYIDQKDRAIKYVNAFTERCIELAFVFGMSKPERYDLQLSNRAMDILPIIYRFISDRLPTENAIELARSLLDGIRPFLITQKDLGLILIAYELENKGRQDIACIWYKYFCIHALNIARYSIDTTWDCFRYARCLLHVGDLKAARRWLRITSKLFNDQYSDLEKDPDRKSREAEFARLKTKIDDLAAKL